jgi:MFS family permease
MQTRRRFLSPLLIIYVVSFFYTLHSALPVYINSTFLATLMPERYVGPIYALSSLLAIVALILIPRLLKALGDYFATVFFIVFEIAALICIAAFPSPAFTIAFFIVSAVLVTLISFDFDLIVEKFSKNASTGWIRGLYLTSANIAWVIAPALAGFILGENQYWRIYLAAALLLLPGLLIFVRKLEHFRDPLYRTIHFRRGLAAVWRTADLRYIFFISFLLYFFFTVMVIYTPIYLHEYIGFPWEKLGVMFSIMLVPFLLLEAWLGRVADRLLGEKELLIAGFIVIAFATGTLSFVTAPSFALWAGLLFATRVGAAMVESMTETYFFKKIGAGDAQMVSFQRTIRPFAGLVGPLAATAFLAVLPLQQIFLALGILMLLGIPFALTLKDTR